MFKGIYWGRSAIFSTIGEYIGGYIWVVYRIDIRYIEHRIAIWGYINLKVFIVICIRSMPVLLWLERIFLKYYMLYM
jgi:hypothetical protein